ncbi:hypothetical protein PtA15_9A426 [Puccinia triticina]|uniref:Uncharacterized protein n=1 Tax=Puccinia triticina TaxID=208348 RepID=A0ABY7CUJ9_9BASI|nr:uncharacterized protein PtA15_9A426 [Puccinia triticina]WAQ88299.1 hypothetical protein PtA15_9A426 [Puccinia triticina]WAR60472.1 hypothetical protein PtB15_9B411 [Puccinia triticina]
MLVFPSQYLDSDSIMIRITTSAQFFIQPNLSQLHPRFTPQSVNPWRLIPQPFHHTHLVAVRLVRTTTARYNQPGRPYAKQNDGSVNFRPTRSHLLFTSAPPSITTALTPQSVDPWRLKPQSHHQTHHVVVCLVRATPARYTSKFRPTRPAYRDPDGGPLEPPDIGLLPPLFFPAIDGFDFSLDLPYRAGPACPAANNLPALPSSPPLPSSLSNIIHPLLALLAPLTSTPAPWPRSSLLPPSLRPVPPPRAIQPTPALLPCVSRPVSTTLLNAVSVALSAAVHAAPPHPWSRTHRSPGL